MTTDLSLLTTAATQWDAAAKDLETVQKTYNSQVRNVGIDEQWQGVARTFAQIANTRTYEQYSAAATEARAIASLLRDAHGQFVELRNKLKSAIADAAKEHMKIDDNGKATWTKRDDPGVKNDPDAATSIPKAEASWTQHIADIVQQFDDADQGVKLALAAATKDSDPNDGIDHGFNAKAEGDIEVVEGRRQAELARLDHWDDKQLAEMQRLERDNKNKAEFSQSFLAGLGPDKTIDYANRLRGLAKGDKKQDYEQLQSGLAANIASATKDTKSSFYDTWHQGLRKAGEKNYGSNTSPLYGYQAFLETMKHGGGYGKGFLDDLGNDIIGTEKKHPGIWNKISGHKDVGNDPLDGLLSIMSKQPDVATSFLDPGADGKNDHLKYLLKDRSWPKLTTIGPAGVHDLSDPATQVGLGAALEAAATGHPPLADGARPDPEARHTAAQTRVMHDTIVLADPGSSSAAPANLRRPLANALAEYGADTHEILSGNTAYPDHDGPWESNGRVNMSVDQDALRRTMRGLSEDPEAYATLHRAASDHISNEMDKLPADAQGYERKNPLDKAGAVLGAYSAIRDDVINDKRASDYSGADWKSKMAYHILGGAVTPVTVGAGKFPIGDALQRGVDYWTWEWANNMKGAADTEANIKISDNYLDTNKQMRTMIDQWAQKHHVSAEGPGKDIIEGMKGDVMIGATRGSAYTKNLLR
ncbi:hypothetical protein [Streptomyces albireticuli]|nr:hypothetical protein [Streptomyces albireticuli]MCD9145941.1 hypothetical protein [Streptomyces albireticuli]MCD9166117.1 hypothetical protein [Streptomyces albireticuli]MCD9196442.1 hypothetical protein [Streptomyces albireticuli]